MSIKDNFEIKETGVKRLDDFRKRSYSFNEQVSCYDRLDGYKREFLLSWIASVKFAVGAKDDYEINKASAVRRLSAFLFADIVDMLPDLELSIYSGDRDAAEACLERLKRIVKGG